jgi:hypothetical protein
MPRQIEQLSFDELYDFRLVTIAPNRRIQALLEVQQRRYRDVEVLTAKQVSLRYQRLADKFISRVNGRDLSNAAIIYIDGMKIAGEDFLWALAVTSDGEKLVGRVATKAGETKKAALDLLDGLANEQRVDLRHVMIVADGGEAIEHAVEERLGSLEQMQRCVIHKKRNVVRDNLSRAEKVEIGRQLVQEQLRGQQRPEYVPEVPLFQIERLRQALGVEKVTLSTVRKVKGKTDAQDVTKAFLNIGERALRTSMQEAFTHSDPDAARAILERTSRWLSAWKLNKASTSLLEGVHQMLTTTRLEVGIRNADKAGKAGKADKTTNKIESVNSSARNQTNRVKRFRTTLGRIRHMVVGLVTAEENFSPAGSRELIVGMSAQLVLTRHEWAVDIEQVTAHDIVFGPTDLREDEALSPRVDAALLDFQGWADHMGQRMVVPTPTLEARKEWLLDHGFEGDVVEGALIRMPGVVGAASPERAKGGRQALETIERATGDRELVEAVARRAVAITAEQLQATGEQRWATTEWQRRLARVHAAADELATLRARVSATWPAELERAAANAAAIEAETGRRPNPFASGRGGVLTGTQRDELLAAIAKQEPEVRALSDERRAEVRADIEPMKSLNGWVVEIETAAEAVAAGHLLDLEHELGQAVDAEQSVPEPPRGPPDEGFSAPIARHRRALGGENAQALTACSTAVATRLSAAELPDRALAELDRRLGEPLAPLADKKPYAAVSQAAQVVAGLQNDRDAMMRRVGGYAVDARDPSLARSRRDASQNAANARQADADAIAVRQAEARVRLEQLQNEEGSPHALMLDGARVALQDAVARELANRGLEHAKPDRAAERRARRDQLDAHAKEAGQREQMRLDVEAASQPREERPVDLEAMLAQQPVAPERAAERPERPAPALAARDRDLADAGFEM